jgi:hypothetical protein
MSALPPKVDILGQWASKIRSPGLVRKPHSQNFCGVLSLAIPRFALWQVGRLGVIWTDRAGGLP